MHRRTRAYRRPGQARGIGDEVNHEIEERRGMDELRLWERKLCTICDNTGDVGWHAVCVEIMINVASILTHEILRLIRELSMIESTTFEPFLETLFV
jgi:hypothetical protein